MRGGANRTMNTKNRVSGRLIAAARALVGVSQEHFAAACDLPLDTLCRLESAGSALVRADTDVAAILRGLNHYGVLIVDETGDLGAGVRLKFTRADVRQIVRLEGEGGIVRADDAP